MPAHIEKRPQRVIPVTRNNDAFTGDIAQKVVTRLRDPVYTPGTDPVMTVKAFEFFAKEIGVRVIAGGQSRGVHWHIRSRHLTPECDKSISNCALGETRFQHRDSIARVRVSEKIASKERELSSTSWLEMPPHVPTGFDSSIRLGRRRQSDSVPTTRHLKFRRRPLRVVADCLHSSAVRSSNRSQLRHFRRGFGRLPISRRSARYPIEMPGAADSCKV